MIGYNGIIIYRGSIMRLCKICNNRTQSIVDKKQNVTYYRCEKCDFIALDNDFMVDALVEKQHYAKHNNSFECSGYVDMFKRFIDSSISPYISTIKKALDFGCGHTPVLAKLLEDRGLEVDIYDLYFFSDEEYKNISYDLITSTEVFEHLKDPKSILEVLVNLLNPNGYIVLMTQFPPSSNEEFLRWWYRRDITHISFFTPKSFKIMAEEFGLKVIEIIDNNIVVFQKI